MHTKHCTKCNSKPKKTNKRKGRKCDLFLCVRKNFPIGQNPIEHFLQPINIILFLTRFLHGNDFPGIISYFLAKTFSGVLILHTPTIKSIKDQIAVIKTPKTVQVNKNIATPEPIFPA